MRTRLSILAGTGAALALVLAGCSSGGGSDGPVNLTYRLWDDHQQIGFQKCIDNFQAANEGIAVTIEQMPWGDYWGKLTADIAAGQGPDLFTNHFQRNPQLASDGVLLPLDDYIKRDNLDLGQFAAGLVPVYEYEGKQFGLPKDNGVVSLAVNLDIVRKLGVTIPDKLTWVPGGGAGDNLIQVAQRLTRDVNGNDAAAPTFDPNRVDTYGLGMPNGDLTFVTWFGQNGIEILNEPFGTEWNYGKPEAIEALAYIADLLNKYHVMPPAELTNPPANAMEIFNRGEVAIQLVGSWQVGSITDTLPFEVEYIPLAYGPKGNMSQSGGLADSIWVGTPHPEESWKLLSYLASYDCQKIMGGEGYVVPALSQAYGDYESYWSGRGIDVSAFVAAAGNTTPNPFTLGYDAASIKVTQVFNSLFLGDITAEEAGPEAARLAAEAQREATGG